MESIFLLNEIFMLFCRNVMIYFDFKTRKELIDKFYNALEYGGYLFIVILNLLINTRQALNM